MQLTGSGLGPLAQSVLQASGWDGVTRALMLAGKQLPAVEPANRTADNEVAGCESDVWLDLVAGHDGHRFRAYSSSKIIRGVLAILLEKANAETLPEVAGDDFAAYLSNIGLSRHLSESRGNGIRVVIQRIQQLAGQASTQP